jgi:hypothetical protein
MHAHTSIASLPYYQRLLCLSVTRASVTPKILDWYFRINGFILSVVDDIPIDSETYVVTSSILSQEFAGSIFECAHKGRFCMHAFIDMSVLVL